MRKGLNIEYATIQGSYWMYFGAIGSFASLFLLNRNYSNWEIGVILAMGSIFAVVLQPFISDRADCTKKLSLIDIVQIMVVLLLIVTAGLFTFTERSFFLSIVFIFLVGWHAAMQPLINSLSFYLEESGMPINFGVARSVGSLAYAGLCALLGLLIAWWGVWMVPLSGEIILIFLLLILGLAKKTFRKGKRLYGIREKEVKIKEKKDIHLLEFLGRNQMFLLVNIGVIGLFFSNAILNNFMMQIVTNVNGDGVDMGRILSIMAILEIPTMIFYKKIRERISNQRLLKIAAIAFTVKIGLCFLATTVGLLYLAQLMQLFAFALFLPAMVHFINEIMDRGEAVKGQALYTIMTTVAGVFASLLGGWILDAYSVNTLLLVSTIATFIGAVLVFLTVDKVPMKRGEGV